MGVDYWPIFGLRLMIGELELRPVVEADLEQLADLLPADLELNPSAPSYPYVTDRQQARGIQLHQEYWRSLGTWTTDAWRLGFAVRRSGELVGFQELEGNEFPLLRTVDTSSWLINEVRGQGLGRLMREAVLTLAFGPMAAQLAITSAWHDNVASLAVSRALGYQPNGEVLHARDGGADRMIHFRLRRAEWLSTGRGADVIIEGFGPCRPLFGLGPDDG